MFDFTKTELRSSVTAIIGAVAFSTVALVAAVGPARAAEPSETARWKAEVESRINGDDMVHATTALQSDRYAIATVALDVDGAGHVTNATLTRSTGSDRLDREALSGARDVDFPRTPGAKPVKVEMNLVLGRTQRAIAQGRAALNRPVAYASKDVGGSSNIDGRIAAPAGM